MIYNPDTDTTYIIQTLHGPDPAIILTGDPDDFDAVSAIILHAEIETPDETYHVYAVHQPQYPYVDLCTFYVQEVRDCLPIPTTLPYYTNAVEVLNLQGTDRIYADAYAAFQAWCRSYVQGEEGATPEETADRLAHDFSHYGF